MHQCDSAFASGKSHHLWRRRNRSNFGEARERSEFTQDLVDCKARKGPCREPINVDVPDTCIRCSD